MLLSKKKSTGAVLFLLLSCMLFAKKKTEEPSLPQAVIEKIQSTEATAKSFYICTVRGKTKVKDIVIGPLETEAQAILVWIHFKYPSQKNYCIARDKLFRTRTPDAFYREKYTKILDYYNTNGADAAFVHYFFNYDEEDLLAFEETEALPKKNAEQKELTQPPAGEKNSAQMEPETPEDNERTKQESEPQEKDAEIQVNRTEPDSLTDSGQAETAEEKTDEARMSEEPHPAQTESPDTGRPETLAAEAQEPPQEESEPQESEAAVVPIFDITSERDRQASAYPQKSQREYLFDYKPAKKPAIPQEELEKETVIETPEQRDTLGRTRLMTAARNGSIAEVQAVLKSGADVNATDKDGWTALMYAVRYQESLTVIASLINAGADPKSKNKYSITPLMMASAYNKNPEILSLLLSKYNLTEKDVIQAFCTLLSSPETEALKLSKARLFLDKGLNINLHCNGKTPLMYAAQYGTSTRVLQLLLDNGAEPALRANDGKTAFDYAAKNPALSKDEIYWKLNKK